MMASQGSKHRVNVTFRDERACISLGGYKRENFARRIGVILMNNNMMKHKSLLNIHFVNQPVPLNSAAPIILSFVYIEPCSALC